MRTWRCWCLHLVHEIDFNSSPETQNNSKNVWSCPALCNHKGMSWDISAFPLQDPSFPTARPGLENLFPLPLSLFLPPSLPPSLCLPSSLTLFVETHHYHKRPVYRRTTIPAQCLQGREERESAPSEKRPFFRSWVCSNVSEREDS